MSETTRLTDADRRTIDRARELTALLHSGIDLDAWREHGETDPLSAMTDLLGKTLVQLEHMIDLVARLDGDG
jgi:serine/threonine protein kinase HipA of HipAB toxin-antitoxin module